MSQKKCDVADYQYFKNGNKYNIQQCIIFRYKNYNFCLVVCETSTQYAKRNKSYELEKNDGSNVCAGL